MERDAYFDNAKIILITLVVFGHMIQPLTEQSTSIQALYTWIYTFHMPAFIFIAGYFAKGLADGSYVLQLARKLLIPYIIFQVIYTAYYFIIGKSNWLTDNIFYPHWSLWFLFSLFCWHLLLIIYRKIPAKYGITLAVVIGVVVGFFDQVGHTFSLSRTFVFFPYFLLGYWISKDHIKLLRRKTVTYLSLFILSIAAILIYYLPDMNTGWLLASKSYGALGEESYGGFIRLTIYFTSIVMGASVLSIIPKRRYSFTPLGERTIYVYLLHGFFIQYFRETGLYQFESIFHLIGMAVISLVIVYMLSSNLIVSLWQPFIEGSASRIRELFHNREMDHRT